MFLYGANTQEEGEPYEPMPYLFNNAPSYPMNLDEQRLSGNSDHGTKSKITLELNLPVSEMVDTCHAYAEEKTFPLLERIRVLEEENKRLRNGGHNTSGTPQSRTPPVYARDLTDSGSDSRVVNPLPSGKYATILMTKECGASVTCNAMKIGASCPLIQCGRLIRAHDHALCI